MVKHIGRYELHQTIGCGHFASVKVAVDRETGAKWAMKIIDKTVLEEATLNERLRCELAAMKLLQHENVIRLREVMQSRGSYYLVLELATRGDLLQRIKASKRLPQEAARRYFQQLMRGVRHCHRLRIAHRDLKPENLLLDENDCLKISDFGLADLQRVDRESGSVRLMRAMCGTLHYMAPEVLAGEGYDGRAADIWSCGVILYVMLTGRFPFLGDDHETLRASVRSGQYERTRWVPDGAADLIAKMLAVDPVARWTAEEIAAHPWIVAASDVARSDSVVTPPLLECLIVSSGSASPTASPKPQSDRSLTPQSTRQAPGSSPGTVSPAAGHFATDSSSVSSVGQDPEPIDAFDVLRLCVVERLRWLTTNPISDADRDAVSSSSFLFSGDPADFWQILEQLELNPRRSASGRELRGFVEAPRGLVTYRILLHATVAPSLWLAEFQRGRGDRDDFQRLCLQVTARLRHSQSMK